MDLRTPALSLQRGCHALANQLGQRPVLSGRGAALLVAVYFTALGNVTLWATLARAARDGTVGPGLLGVILLVVVVANWMLGLLVNIPGVFKPVVAVLLSASVIVDHFMRAYGVVIDSTMVQNTVETDGSEVGELITLSLLVHLLVFGVVPLALLLRAEIRYRKPLAELRHRLGAALVGFAVLGGLGAGFYKDLAVFMRNHRQLRHVITPFNYLAAVQRYARQRGIGGARAVTAIGLDARQAAAARDAQRHRLLVLVVGETARAANFSLNGYGRQTNPELADAGVISYTDFTSCATDTSTALRCMFSGMRRTDYRDEVGKYRENLLDVVQRAGVRVLWRENNTGCKNVCDRVPTEVLSCTTGECLDEELLGGLDELLPQLETDTVIVLHQRGSHGPAYHWRYPEAFRRFVPTCETNDLRQCSREAIRNTYDNTILYTDHVLGEAIRLLRRHADRLDVGLVYVSDHGESLGENGVYLHSLPYWIAPDEQTHVPFVVWLADDRTLDPACIARRRAEPFSHDNLFHTMLGLLDVETQVYDPVLDLLDPCRSL